MQNFPYPISWGAKLKGLLLENHDCIGVIIRNHQALIGVRSNLSIFNDKLYS